MFWGTMNIYLYERIPHMKSRYILLLLVLFLFLSSTSVSAAALLMMDAPLHGHEIQVTSPFSSGRTHPITGVVRRHNGIDIGGEAHEPVYAVADGEVALAVRDDSFDGYVILQHTAPDGSKFQTWYGDLDPNDGYLPAAAIMGSIDRHVQRGQLIGYLGPAWETSVSTGPHLHFEVRINDSPISPALYHPYAPWLPDNATDDGLAASRQGKRMVWDAAFAFMEPVKKAIDTIALACTKAVDLLKDIIKYVIGILMTIDLALTYILMSVDREKGQEPSFSIFKLLALKMLLYLLLFYTITYWGAFLINGSRDLFLSLGAATSGVDLTQAKAMLVDPTALVTKGAQIIEPIFTVLNETDASGFDWLNKIVTGLFGSIFLLIIFGSFLLFAFEIILAYLEFYFVAVFSLANFMFAGHKWSRRYAENGMNGIFSASIKLFFFCFFALMLQSVMSNMVVDDLIHVQTVPVEEAMKNNNGNFGGREGIDEVLEAIRRVETGGQEHPFQTPSQDGWGYGAYQISYEYWNVWCERAGFEPPPMPWADDSEAWSDPGYQSRPYSGAWEDQFPPATTPWPENVQTAVARHHLLELYDANGSWEKAAGAWNGDRSGGYWRKVVTASNSIQKTKHVLQVAILLKLALVCFLFVMMGDKLSQLVIKQFGIGNGFKFLPGT